MFPPNLNVPLPDPQPLAPQQTLQPESDPAGALNLIAPLFALGAHFGGSPTAGAALLHGTHGAMQQREAARATKQHQDEQMALQQQQLAESIAQHQAAEEAKRQAGIQKLIADTSLQVKGLPKSDYDAIVTANEQMGGAFFGLRPNALRASVPYRAPNAATVMAEAGKKFLSNPANKEAIEQGNLDGSVMVDVQDDGIPVPVPVRDVLKAAGTQFDPGTGKPLVMTKAKAAPTNIQPDDVVFLGKVAEFEAEKGRPATDVERGQIMSKVIKGIADDRRAPPMVINTGGMSLDDRVKLASQAILDHRLAPSQITQVFGGGMGKEAAAFKQAVGLEVIKQNPTFNFQEAESGYQFGKNIGTQNTVRFLDNITKTMPRLRAASGDLKRGGVRVINQALLSANRQFGNTKVATFDTDRLILADEIAKVLQGGGTGSGTSDAKLKQAGDLLRGDMSVGQFDATLNEIEELLSTRRNTLTGGTFMQQPDSGGDAAVVVRGPDGKLMIKRGPQ